MRQRAPGNSAAEAALSGAFRTPGVGSSADGNLPAQAGNLPHARMAEAMIAHYSERSLRVIGASSQAIVKRTWVNMSAQGQRKVLLVEDEALVAALAADALEELGYQAVEAATAKSALEIAAGATPFLFAIVDVGLPDGRGDALALELRKLRAGLPLIIATGYDQAHLDQGLRQGERTAVLNKPYDIAQLQEAIGRIVDPAAL